MQNNEDGCFNSSADEIDRLDETWSDTNPDREWPLSTRLKRLKCNACGGKSFEVLQVEHEYMTMAKCNRCFRYFIAHSG